jgi:predicted ATPase with chaperone activity
MPASSIKRAVCCPPCPCAYAGDAERSCTCSPLVVAYHQKRISGLLLDRIVIHVEVPGVNAHVHLSAPCYHNVVKLTLTVFDCVDVLGVGLICPAEVIWY